MKYALIALLLLVACTAQTPVAELNETNVTPVSNATPIVETKTCEEVTCGVNEECRQGECFCKIGYKICDGACIPDEECCTYADCGPQESCISKVCVKTEFCTYNEEFSAGTCACEEGAKWCAEQQKCIPSNSCCSLPDCNPTGKIDRLCKETEYGAYLCVRIGVSEHCRDAIPGERTGYSVGARGVDVYLEQVYAGGLVDMRVVAGDVESNISKLAEGSSEKVSADVSVTNKKVVTSGGNCRTA